MEFHSEKNTHYFNLFFLSHGSATKSRNTHMCNQKLWQGFHFKVYGNSFVKLFANLSAFSKSLSCNEIFIQVVIGIRLAISLQTVTYFRNFCMLLYLLIESPGFWQSVVDPHGVMEISFLRKYLQVCFYFNLSLSI